MHFRNVDITLHPTEYIRVKKSNWHKSNINVSVILMFENSTFERRFIVWFHYAFSESNLFNNPGDN